MNCAREGRFILYLSYVYGIFIVYLWYVVGWERVGDREQGVRNREYGAGGCEKIFVLLLWNGDFFMYADKIIKIEYFLFVYLK